MMNFPIARSIGFVGVAGLTLFLTGCGGGSAGGTTTPTPSAQIISVTPDRLMYGKQTRFTVVGTNLDRGVTLSSSACANIGSVTGGSATQQVFTCTPSATGTIVLNFLSTGTSVPYASNQTIPLPRVTFTTNLGDMVFELYPASAPLSVNNFLQYVSDNFYTNLTFHRVIRDFVIQGGGFNSALQASSTRAPIKLESLNGLHNVRGSLAMARTNVADSATSQFYINTVDNSAVLDGTSAGVDGYAVFGKVVSDLALVDQIRAVPVGDALSSIGVLSNVPLTPIVIMSATQTQ